MKRLAILLVGVTLLAACGGGSDKSTPSPTSAGSAATSAATAATTTSSATPANASTPVSAAATPSSTASPAASATTAVSTEPTSQSTAAPTAASTAQSTAAATAAPSAAATTAATAASTQAASVGQLTQDQLKGALLAVSDMPDGWSDVPPDPSSDVETTGFCKPDEVSGIDQVRAIGAFQQENQGLFLQETLTGFAAGDSTAWMDWVKPTLDCAQATDTSVDPPMTYQVTSLMLPAMGDQMLAYRLSASDPTLGDIAFDIVYSRVGNCVATVENLALGVANTDLTQSATKAAVDRARPVCGG